VAHKLVDIAITGRIFHVRAQGGPVGPLIAATAISMVSLFFNQLADGKTLATELVFSYVPLLLGLAAMWLCVLARRRTARKRLVTLYAVILAPFAFSYPAWMVLLLVAYKTGSYTGPMP
jgi:hypothetical protein